MNLDIDLQVASSCDELPGEDDIHRWVAAALNYAEHTSDSEICIRIVDADESRELNAQYRDKDKPTNVLSFPADLPEEFGLPLLGDLVICAPVVTTEALEQHKTTTAHWAHMVVHGILHLLGYDHIVDADAETMESLETAILIGLGFPPPYETSQGEERTNP